MVNHLLHAALAKCHELCDYTEELLRDINGEALHWLLQLSIHCLENHLWLSDGQFKTFTAHNFNENSKL